MKILVFNDLKNHLSNQNFRHAFMDAIEIRQRLYQEMFPQALILDKYDLIATHIVIYDQFSTQAIGYVRTLSSNICLEHQVPLPIEGTLENSPEHYQAYQEFLNICPVTIHMSYLCFDREYKQQLEGRKTIDLLTYLGLRVFVSPGDKAGYCGTPNSLYRFMPALSGLGDLLCQLPPLMHPVIPSPHDLVLVPQISDKYWSERSTMFAQDLNKLVWINNHQKAA